MAVRQPTINQTLSKRWGDAVASRRMELGFSQTTLAALCDVKQQTISKIEAGAMIPADHLKATIADRLMKEPADLFAWPTRAEMAKAVA